MVTMRAVLIWLMWLNHHKLLLIISVLSMMQNGLTMAQNCSMISDQEILALLYEYHPSFDEGPPKLVLMEYNITCLSHSLLQERYRYTTLSIKYVNLPKGFTNNETLTAVMDIGCSMENSWDSSVLDDTEAFKWSDSVPSDHLRSDCRLCNGAESDADPVTHCVACNTNCSVPGTLQGCYHNHADNDDHCCLVYSNGLCSEQCENEHYSVNDSFICGYVNINNSAIDLHYNIEMSTGFVTSSATQYASPSMSSHNTHTISSLINSPVVTSTPVNSKDFPTLLHLSIFLSGITCLVTVIISVSISLTVVVCACCCIKCRQSRAPAHVHRPVVTMSSVGTVSEYVEPLTSPSTNTERSLVISESLSMQLNSSYSRGSGRYITAGRVPPVQYEDPDLVLDDIKNQRRPSVMKQPSLRETTRLDNEHSYVTIIA